MEIIIARHGLSKANAENVVSGQFDTPLTKKGKQQAEDLARRLDSLEIDQIYSSPLKRAMETALPIAERVKLTVNADNRLMEVGFGRFEGQPMEVFAKELGLGKNITDFLNSYDYDFTAYGGESAKQVEARVRAFLDELKKQDHKLVLIICHGGILRWVNYIITGEKIGKMPNAEELSFQY